MWETKKGITEFDKRTVKCDIGTIQCEDGTIKCKKKVKEPPDKNTCTHCFNDYINILIKWHNLNFFIIYKWR